jgi:hypothetical protein
MSARRPHPGPDPSAASWGIVLLAALRALAALGAHGIRLATFGARRARWRREVAARVRRDPL